MRLRAQAPMGLLIDEYLYNVLRFVHEAKAIKARGPYVKLLRAQLSDYELVMLFYTALNKHGINY